MRLRRLNLLRYGHFTDFTLDFGEISKSGLDFHIIFGENEAGKSTAFNAYLDLLFGIEKNSKYNFLHLNSNLHIGATLVINDDNIEIARIKKDKANLVGANGFAVDESILGPALRGLSRESYQKMFSLNDETIEKGGEEILASKGDLGRLLFAGTAGLTDLSTELDVLRERANKIYAQQSRSYEISSLRQELQQIDNERKNLDTQSNTYDRLIKSHRAIDQNCQDTRNKKKELAKEKVKLNSLKEAFAIWSKLIKLEEELELIEHLPDVPGTWIKEIKDLQQSFMIAMTNKESAQSNIDSGQEELEILIEDLIVIEAKEKIGSIVHLKIRSQTACEILPQARDSLSSTESELEGIRKRLGVDESIDLAQFIISDDVMAGLEELLQKEIQLTNRLHTAKQEASNAQDALLKAQNEAKETTLPNENITLIGALLDEYTDNDSQPLLHQTQETLDQIRRDIESAFQKLSPWTGSKVDLQTREIPAPAQINRWSVKINSLEKNFEIQKAQKAHQEQKLASHKSKVKTLSEQLGVITDNCAENSRKARDNAWTIHKKSLDQDTAVAFEQVLLSDDRIRDDRLKATAHLAQLRIEEGNLAEANEMLKATVDELKRIEFDIQEVRKGISVVCNKAGLPENFQLEDLSKWVEDVHSLRGLIDEEKECLVKKDQAEIAYDRQRKRLLEVLANTSQMPLENLNLKELRRIGQRYRDEAVQQKNEYTHAKKSVSQAEEQTEKRNTDLREVEEDFKKWEESWKFARQGTWLKEKNASQVRTLLEILRRLTPLVTEKERLNQEICTKEKAIQDFHENVRELLRFLGEDKKSDLEVHFSHIQERLEAAQLVGTKRATILKNQERSENQLNNANSEISRIENRTKQMAEFFTTYDEPSTLDELTILVEKSERKRQLKILVSEKEAILNEHLKVKTRNDIEEELRAKDLSDVETRLSMIDGEIETVDLELEKLIGETRDAQRNIDEIGADASVARLNEKRESVLLEISNKANQALALHLGLMAADHALVSYRNRHRSELLAQTAEAFKSITAGEFVNLTTQLDRSEEKLIAVRAGGGSIAVSAMSKGTRFQLYLALRLAGYRRFCGLNGSLPFIGDDIMETFDDGRAESAIRQLSEIAKSGQVLYFTHHRHLCEIATKVCGNGVVIHEIPKNKR